MGEMRRRRIGRPAGSYAGEREIPDFEHMPDRSSFQIVCLKNREKGGLSSGMQNRDAGVALMMTAGIPPMGRLSPVPPDRLTDETPGIALIGRVDPRLDRHDLRSRRGRKKSPARRDFSADAGEKTGVFFES